MQENSMLNSTIEETLNNNASSPKITFKLSKTAKYKFPKYNDVPPDWYYSQIMAIENSVTSTGKPAFDICYKIVNWYQLIRKINGTLPADHKLVYYYTRERCVYDSISERAFIESMIEGCNFDEDYEFAPGEVIGVCEKYRISYRSENSLGSIENRMVITEDDINHYISMYTNK